MEDSRNVSNPLNPNVRLENEECEDNPADRNLYLSLIGSLMYAALGSCPDISFAVSSLSRYNSVPLAIHLTAAKRVLRDLPTRTGQDVILRGSPSVVQYSRSIMGPSAGSQKAKQSSLYPPSKQSS
jgi:hypothetical protein